MSLKEFLAVGRSFAGSPREKSPFEMRQDVRLPMFESTPRYTAKHPGVVQMDWIEQKKPLAVTPPAAEMQAGSPVGPGRRRRGWLEVMTFGLLGKPNLSSAWVQAEMNLDNVRVVRNDLADSDLEVVVKKKKGFALRRIKVAAKPEEQAPTPARTTLKENLPVRRRPEWSELAVRLFEIGQKQ